jgi:hypothetical protein
MIHGVIYVVGEEGEKKWKGRWSFDNLTPLQISKEKIASIRQDFYANQGENFININKYLVEGVYLEFIQDYEEAQDDKKMVLVLKGNSKESVNGLAKKLELPQINKPNQSE